VIDKHGVSADPSKTAAILKMEEPRPVTELQRFMGMVNQLGKFSSAIAEISQPLRELLSSKRLWVWGPGQQKAFQDIKAQLASPPTLALYSPDAPTKICADASAYGLGAVILQQMDGSLWKPIAFASCSMTQERRYSQIEKEALALVWACEKFADYVIGMSFVLETDHKPLVPLLGKTNLDSSFAFVFSLCVLNMPFIMSQASCCIRQIHYPVHHPLHQQPAILRKVM
jgi:hypothetical protein